MVVKNLFASDAKQFIIERINKLTSESKPLWGKMNVAQMLAHCQMPMGVALGSHKLKGGMKKREGKSEKKKEKQKERKKKRKKNKQKR